MRKLRPGIVVIAVLTLILSMLSVAPAVAAPVGGAEGGTGGAANGPGQAAPPPASYQQPTNLPTIENGYGATPAQQQAMAAASTQARTAGKPVAVAGLTTETQQVMAQPHGGFALSANTRPVRTLSHGAWVPVDTTLHRNADGTWSPAATAYGTVTLSGGGQGPLATTTSGSTTYAVAWPGRLPTPTVAGSTATYADVLQGVDLVVAATVTGGFSEVLVVKDAAAARNPALASLNLPTTVTGGQIRARSQGDLVVSGPRGATTTLQAPTPMMWDSNTSLTATAAGAAMMRRVPTSAHVAADPSDATQSGMAARQAVVHTHVTGTTLSLTPDAGLLHNPKTAFPLYIDPTFNWQPTTANPPVFDEVKQGAPCTNTSFYDNTSSGGDDGQLGVGYNSWNSCFGIERTYYQWQLPTVIWGAHIGNVAGQPGATVDVTKVYSASCTTTSTDWLHWTGGIGSGTSWNNQPAPAPATGPGVAIGASANPDHCPTAPPVVAGFDVTSQIAASAGGHASQFTVALTGNETPGNVEFSRFSDNPTLQIFYNLIPNTPGPLWAAAGADNVGCATATPYPYMGKTLATNSPVLHATVSDPDNDHLQASYKYWIDGQATTNTGVSADNLPSGGTALFSLPSSFVSGLANGQIVDWQVQVTDGEDWSGWSQTCHFIAEPIAPSAPAITSADGKYPNDGTVGATTGTPGQFTVATTGGSVTSLVDGLGEAPPTNSPPASDKLPFGPGGVITPTGRWKLADGSGTTATDAVGGHPATLSATGATWSTGTSRGTVLTVDGSAGYAATTAPVVNSAGSFSVAAWVDPTALTTAWQTVLIGQGTIGSSFYLEYDGTDGEWSFSRLSNDSTTPTVYRAQSGATATANVWTHLVATYDSTTGTMTLYVNGTATGTTVDSSPWNATGPLVLGRAFNGGGFGGYLNGSISDVQTYQAALSSSDIAAIYAGGVAAPAGRWRLVEGTGATAADSSGNSHPATLSGGYTWTTSPVAGVTFNGTNGSAATSGPVLTTTASFTVSAWVNLTSTAGWAGAVAQAGVHDSGFYLQYSLADGKWSFSRVTADGGGGPVRALSSAAPTLNVWTQLVGVYNAANGSMTLYVNGQAQGSATDSSPWNATGPLLIGAQQDAGARDGYFPGAVSDVQAYPEVLGAKEIAQMYESSTTAITPKAPGPHTLYAYATDAAGNVSGYQSYRFLAATDPTTTCASLTACFDNTAISPDNNASLGAADGLGSFSATDLTNAGWTSGGHVSINGATFTLPTYGAGQPDNVLAAAQTVTYNDPVPATGASALEFLATSTYADLDGAISPGAISGNDTAPYVPAGTAVAASYCFDKTNPAAFCAPQGTIHYSDGSSQSYYLTVPDWVIGPASLAAIRLPHQNRPTGQLSTENPMIFPFSVPLTPGKTVTSVTLPDVSATAAGGQQALHIFGMTTRDTTTTGAPTGQTWTGAWANATEGQYNFEGTNFANQTFRVAVKPSLSGNTVRIKLDDALGTSPLQIGQVTIAADSGSGSPSSVPAATPVSLSFGGVTPTSSAPLTIPEGGMVYSDPLNFALAANQYVLVSYQLVNSVPDLVQHSWTNTAYQYVSAVNSGNLTTDTTGTPFSGTGTHQGWFTDVLTDLDVTTHGVPTQAVLGDGLIDAWQPNSKVDATIGLPDDLTATEPTTPSGYGTVAEGIEANEIMTDNAETTTTLGALGGPSALSRIDRDILDQPGITTVVLDEGLDDVLNGRSASDLTSNGYTELLGYLQAYNINTVIIGQTPCDGYAGGGETTNDPCTAAVDGNRTQANQWLSSEPLKLSPWTTPEVFYLDPDTAIGVPDTSNGETKLNAAADNGDHVNLTNAGYAALTTAYLGAQDTWQLNDGTGNTQAADSADNATNPYLINNPTAGNNPATLTGTTTWTTDPTRGPVLTFDGTTGYATTPGPVLTTTDSFSISAWVNLTNTNGDATVVSQAGTTTAGFSLQYHKNLNSWAFTMPTSDSTTATQATAHATTAPTLNTWTHLVGTYNATTATMTLYVNGVAVATATNTTPWNATGPLTIAAATPTANPATSFFPGSISTVQTWNYTLTPTQITALNQQIN